MTKRAGHGSLSSLTLKKVEKVAGRRSRVMSNMQGMLNRFFYFVYEKLNKYIGQKLGGVTNGSKLIGNLCNTSLRMHHHFCGLQ